MRVFGGKNFLRSDFCSLPFRRAEARLRRAKDVNARARDAVSVKAIELARERKASYSQV